MLMTTVATNQASGYFERLCTQEGCQRIKEWDLCFILVWNVYMGSNTVVKWGPVSWIFRGFSRDLFKPELT